ncbi:MAG TPA: epimerase, partial [Bacteroidetes bacterium]|nr:epimerase [Bacteroidota bacterium]
YIIIYTPKNYVDVELRIPSIEKAKDLLGFVPQVDLNEGIIKTFNWYKKNI